MSTGQTSLYTSSTNTYFIVCVSSILCIFTSFILLRILGTQFLFSKNRVEDPFPSQKRSEHSQYRSLKSYFTLRSRFTETMLPMAMDDFDNRKDLYRQRRDEFRKSATAMRDLAEWKAQNNDHEYTVL